MNFHLISRVFGLFAVFFSVIPAWSRNIVPVEDFFREPAYGDMALSPDGSKLAVAARYKERLALAVIDVKTKEPKLLTAPKGFDVAGIFWVGSNRILFRGITPGDQFSPKSYNGGLYAIDADGKNSKTLCESYEQQVRGKEGRLYVARFAEVMGKYGDSTDEILIRHNERREQDPDVYRLNVHTGSKRLVVMNPGFITSYIADHKGVVRVGVGIREHEFYMIYRRSAGDEWREVRRWTFGSEAAEARALVPIAFENGNKRIYVSMQHGDAQTACIALYDPEADTVGAELFGNDTYDISNVMLSDLDHRSLGYYYYGERGIQMVWTDRRHAELQALLDAELPGLRNFPISMSRDESSMIIFAANDRDPGTYYYFNSKEMTMEKLIKPHEWINPAQMAEMRPIEYKARDGLTIHGYLTVPVGMEARNLPMVVHPHGGPWNVRDHWGFNPTAQFLANRGYAVLQVNFRMSAGYGRKFERAGHGQWGLAMQDDITDGVKWAVGQGYADPGRIAIFGGSYGGFATMAGLAFTPELYRCGINYVGVTDVKLLLSRLRSDSERTRAILETMTGNAKRDGEKIDRASPMKNAALIKAPVFFAYGEKDPIVDLRHGTRFISKLKSNGIPVEVMIKNNEGHGFKALDNQVDFYGAVHAFLKKYMNL